MKTYNNWKPVIASLLSALQKAGFALHSVDDGGNKVRVPDVEQGKPGFAKAHRALLGDAIESVDESHLFVRCPADGKVRWVFVVLGNSPSETVADYLDYRPLEGVLTEWSESWVRRGDSVPQITESE